MVGRYPNGGANAGRDYLGGIAAVLVAYPRCVAALAHDPLKGVPREVKFLPTPADVIAWCERESAWMRRVVDKHQQSDDYRKNSEQRLCDEAVADAARKVRPTYEELKAKYGPNWGITNPDKPRPPTREECRARLIAEIGQEAFDAIPDAGYDHKTWQKLRTQEAAE